MNKKLVVIISISVILVIVLGSVNAMSRVQPMQTSKPLTGVSTIICADKTEHVSPYNCPTQNNPDLLSNQNSAFTTYTNKNFGFSIDYPRDWVIDENLPNGNIGIKDRMVQPNAVFEITQMQNAGSFDTTVSTYIKQVGVAGYPIILQSQVKSAIKDKEAYRIQYTETIGNSVCNNEDYVINGGDFVTTIKFGNCDQDHYRQFLPTFEKIVSTFR
jgi:hypothetical protein